MYDSSIFFPPAEGKKVGTYITVEGILDIKPWIAAQIVGVTLEDYLETVDRWSKNKGLPFGVTVDKEAQTITQVGSQ
jgi:hypothetical protein